MSDLQTLIQSKRDESARIAAEAAQLEAIAVALKNPELRRMLVNELGVASPSASTRRTAKPVSNSYMSGPSFTKVREFLTSQGSTPSTIKQMARAASISESMVRQLLSKTNAFEKVGTNEHRQGMFVLANRSHTD